MNFKKNSKYFRELFYKVIEKIDKVEKIMKLQTSSKMPDEFAKELKQILKNDVSAFVTRFPHLNSYLRDGQQEE